MEAFCMLAASAFARLDKDSVVLGHNAVNDGSFLSSLFNGKIQIKNRRLLYTAPNVLSRGLSAQGLLQTPGGGHLGKGGGGMEGRGGKFLLPFPEPGPKAGVAGGV
ncbi:hypothetical protein EYF80_056396 [Liparis tanakae]|uniref:Uncharacterized protein n=1 Tax=Liparis tanakae TaxID=230148 RepID=A0A4Z2EXY9_9TELE|nr:hypothetical protein EYF80_056396 [Liparis tanakae]